MNHYFAMMECGFQCYFAERVQLGQLAKAVKNSLAYIKFRFVCCPPVGGNYLVSYPDHPDWKTEPVKVHQIGFYIKGDFNTPQDNESYEFTGNVTASRIISYQFRPKNTRLNEYGAGLIKMNQNGKEGDGYVLFLSEENERPVPVKLVIKLIPDK